MSTQIQPEIKLYEAPLYSTALDPTAVQPGIELILSKMDKFRMLPREQREQRLAQLTDEEKIALNYAWNMWARPTQLLPVRINPATGKAWVCWLVQAGRGYGKTRTGVETVRQWVREGSNPIIHVIAPTNGDLNKVILDGPAGFVACCDPRELVNINRGTMTLIFANGVKVLLFSAEEPERLRGPQCYKLWADELAAWKYPERTWDNAMFGLRLGTDPQVVVSTTPKPISIIKKIASDPNTIVTRGATYENKHNLAPSFLAQVVAKYQGTRLGRQELYAELLEDNPGALWNYTLLEKLRVGATDFKTMRRIVIGVDPSASSSETSDECGIVACGEGPESPPHYYALEDKSLIAHPNLWARAAVSLYHALNADCIVAEKNNGGEMVEAVLHHVDANVPVKLVTASRGKLTRAEPIAALYEQQRCHHVGMFAVMESQMCDYNPATSTESPDRMDALVWAMTELSSHSWGLFELWKQEAAAKEQPQQAARVDVLGQPLPPPVNFEQRLKETADAQKKDTNFDYNWFGTGAAKPKPPVQIACDKCGSTAVRVYSETWECVCGGHGLRPGAKPIPR